jgi:hypothetical protein
LLGAGPAVLIGYALYVSRGEKVFGSLSALVLACAVGMAGPVLYWLTAVLPNRRRPAEARAAD